MEDKEFIAVMEEGLHKRFYTEYNRKTKCFYCGKMVVMGLLHLVEKHTQKEIDEWFSTLGSMPHILGR